MNISPLFLAIRAVSAEFANRIYLPIVGIVGGVLLIALIAGAVLINFSDLWWLLLVPAMFLFIIFAIAATIGGIFLRMLRPRQTKDQKKNVASFVDSLQWASEAVATPKFILLLRLVKDLVFPSKTSLVNEVSTNTSSLTAGFARIIRSFQQ